MSWQSDTLAAVIMDWKTNHLLLVEKLVLHIDQVGTTTFDKLEARALQHGISMAVFDRAIERLHKLPQIKRTMKLGTVHYELQAVVEKKPVTSEFGGWLRENYPWPGKNGVPEFVMPFPEWDLSWIFLTPDELEEYKNNGRRVFKRKRYEHTRR